MKAIWDQKIEESVSFSLVFYDCSNQIYMDFVLLQFHLTPMFTSMIPFLFTVFILDSSLTRKGGLMPLFFLTFKHLKYPVLKFTHRWEGFTLLIGQRRDLTDKTKSGFGRSLRFLAFNQQVPKAVPSQTTPCTRQDLSRRIPHFGLQSAWEKSESQYFRIFFWPLFLAVLRPILALKSPSSPLWH